MSAATASGGAVKRKVPNFSSKAMLHDSMLMSWSTWSDATSTWSEIVNLIRAVLQTFREETFVPALLCYWYVV